jgi:hypothetical protein
MKHLQKLTEKLEKSDIDINFQVSRTKGLWLLALRFGDSNTLFARSERLDRAFTNLDKKARVHLTTKGE